MKVGTVDIPGLAKIGSTVDGCSADFDKARTAYAEHLDPRLTPQWAVHAASADAVSAWRTFVAQLAGQVHDLGQSLRTAARELQEADERAADLAYAAGIAAAHGYPR